MTARTSVQGSTQSRIFMDTVVTIEVASSASTPGQREKVQRAFGWFEEVERRCSRFDPGSELRRLAATLDAPVPVSRLLFNAVDFALKVAAATGGAFDPTVGAAMEAAGFDRHHRSGMRTPAGIVPAASGSMHDVVLDHDRGTIRLLKPVVLDLGAVAKGLAMDLAAEELAPLADFAINAGGDVLVRGLNADGEAWRIGLRHPRRPGEVFAVVALTQGAVCTSGDYERTGPSGHHILDPRPHRSAHSAISVTVIGPVAMACDALSTAAFVLGPDEGIALLQAHQVEGIILDGDLRAHHTPGTGGYLL